MSALYPIAFRVCSAAAAVLYLLMILAPRWATTRRIMRSGWVLVPFCLAYAILEIPNYLRDLPHFLQPDRPWLTGMLGSPQGTIIAWTHFIALDLFAARWAYLDSRERNLPPLLMAPVIALTLLFGPTGVLSYALVCKVVPPAPAAEPPTAHQEA